MHSIAENNTFSGVSQMGGSAYNEEFIDESKFSKEVI